MEPLHHCTTVLRCDGAAHHSTPNPASLCGRPHCCPRACEQARRWPQLPRAGAPAPPQRRRWRWRSWSPLSSPSECGAARWQPGAGEGRGPGCWRAGSQPADAVPSTHVRAAAGTPACLACLSIRDHSGPCGARQPVLAARVGHQGGVGHQRTDPQAHTRAHGATCRFRCLNVSDATAPDAGHSPASPQAAAQVSPHVCGWVGRWGERGTPAA